MQSERRETPLALRESWPRAGERIPRTRPHSRRADRSVRRRIRAGKSHLDTPPECAARCLADKVQELTPIRRDAGNILCRHRTRAPCRASALRRRPYKNACWHRDPSSRRGYGPIGGSSLSRTSAARRTDLRGRLAARRLGTLFAILQCGAETCSSTITSLRFTRVCAAVAKMSAEARLLESEAVALPKEVQHECDGRERRSFGIPGPPGAGSWAQSRGRRR